MGELRVIEGFAGGNAFNGKPPDTSADTCGIGEEELAAFAGLEVVEGPGGRMKRAREALGQSRGKKFTQEELAIAVGVTKAAVAQWENGLAKPDKSRRPLVAQVLQCSEEWLFAEPRAQTAHQSGEPNYLKRSTVGKLLAPSPRGSATLPIRGTIANPAGDFSFTGQVSDYRRRPPALSDSQFAYGFVMRGKSMFPVFEEGRIVYVDPGRAVQMGDYAVIEMKPDEDGRSPVIVRRLVYMAADALEIWQANPDKRYSVPEATVAHMHRILRGEDLI